MDAGELETFYQEEYRRLYHGDAKPLEDALAVQQERQDQCVLNRSSAGYWQFRGIAVESVSRAIWVSGDRH
jgi:hypothetical protein